MTTLKQLFEGALVRQRERKQRDTNAFAKSVTNSAATYETLSAKKQKNVDLALSGARKVAKLVGCSPLAVINWYQGGMTDAAYASKLGKFFYSDVNGKSAKSPKDGKQVVLDAGGSEKEFTTLSTLDFKDELVVAKAMLKKA
jgi:hypothetical protein